MPIDVVAITPDEASNIIATKETQFADVKRVDLEPRRIMKAVSAFANTDGGDLYIGIGEDKLSKTRFWQGFQNQEAANGHLQPFEQFFPLGKDFQYEFMECPAHPGLVLHIQVSKTKQVMPSSDGIPYIRRGAQSLPCTTAEERQKLNYLKGVSSFETELLNVSKETVTLSNVLADFIKTVVPTSEPEKWLRKQQLVDGERPTVGGVLLFADEPQAALPKRSGIKVYRYKTTEADGFRDALAFTPRTIEGCIYAQIAEAVKLTREITETIPKLGLNALETIRYPVETLHEIITNAVIHRDYSVADDVHIRVFDNRIEVESPGRLPGHVTVANILNERCARNGAILRLLNKFPDPPNQDIGEGLNTAFAAMHSLGLKEPVITEKENSVLVTIPHEQLASPEDAIMTYLETHETIKNAEARRIAHVRADHQMKTIFGRMVKSGMIEQVPGTKTSNTAYRKKRIIPPLSADDSGQVRLL